MNRQEIGSVFTNKELELLAAMDQKELKRHCSAIQEIGIGF